MKLVLDTGVLSRIANPKAQDSAPVRARLEQVRATTPGLQVYVPEIADYEVRRKLLHLKKQRSIRHLDATIRIFTYLPVDTPTMKRAAQLWAEARWRGRPTGPEDSLDADVILAAQALAVGGTVATTNVKHLAQFVPVQDWSR